MIGVDIDEHMDARPPDYRQSDWIIIIIKYEYVSSVILRVISNILYYKVLLLILG